MMYSDKLAFAVKVNGKVLREQNETTFLPFGSHYSLFIKNMNSQRALVHIEIDGSWIGADFIVNGNSSIDIERFVKEGNLKVGNKFKFIERTAAIEDGPRGIKVEDGLIRVEYEFEREPVPLKYPDPWYNYGFNPSWPRRPDIWYSASPGSYTDQLARGEIMGIYNDKVSSTGAVDYQNSTATGSTVSSGDTANASSTGSFAGLRDRAGAGVLRSKSLNAASAAPPEAVAQSLNAVGITAPGAVSHQSFQTAYFGLGDGVKHVMVMKLLGQVGDAVVEKPVTVKHKPTCVTCGKVNKATAKFCAECGTGLNLV